MASQSYWIPANSATIRADIGRMTITDFGTNTTSASILSGSIKTGSYRIKDSRHHVFLINVSHLIPKSLEREQI